MKAKDRGESFEGDDRSNESFDEKSEATFKRYYLSLLIMIDRYFMKHVIEGGWVAYMVAHALVAIITVTAAIGFWVVVVWIMDLFQ